MTTGIDEQVFTIGADFVAVVMASLEANDSEKLAELLEPLHGADIADLLEQLEPDARSALIALWGPNFESGVLSEIDDRLQGELLESLQPEQLADAVRELESDDIVDLVEDLEELQQDAILDVLDDKDRAAVEQSLLHPEDSAGRLMQREVVWAPSHWTVGETIDFLRSESDLPEEFYHVMLVDPTFAPVGQVALGRLMASKRDVYLVEIVEEDYRVIPATQSQQDVAYAFNQYHLISAPVIDKAGRLIGMITIDDAMAVLDEEAEEDIMRLAGVGDESLSDRVFGITRQRFPWLIINLLTAIIASVVIAQFSETIEAVVALAVLMPIVASMGGNAGTQSLTVAVRAIATKDLTDSNAWRIISRECQVGLLNGILFALIIGAVGMIWYGMPMLGLVLGLAMIINMLSAGLAGILIPIGLDRAKVDPALASGVFVTTVTDVVGFLAFLGLAAIILI